MQYACYFATVSIMIRKNNNCSENKVKYMEKWQLQQKSEKRKIDNFTECD